MGQQVHHLGFIPTPILVFVLESKSFECLNNHKDLGVGVAKWLVVVLNERVVGSILPVCSHMSVSQDKALNPSRVSSMSECDVKQKSPTQILVVQRPAWFQCFSASTHLTE